ncbi:endonuclease/exonuclease/phosphatase (EEP) superfamily protein YafD [Rhodoligotrophos appendicifer]|uniref:endonuclease/exonuclease/phosphatase family protein n=1 Tax=Rhodoligotrophos appendicifer TaxID=987056 RepID=UPI001184D2F2|nr:endonuclease/exonuclease/phosphatase family protein [Rhodoligotrophos appendicifer]
MIPSTSLIVVSTGILAALAVLVLGYLGTLWLPLDILANFRLHAAGAALILMVALLVPRLWFTVSLTGFLILMILIGLSAHFAVAIQPAERAPLQGERQVKLLSFNSWASNNDLAAIEQMLRGANADLVVMQEVFSDKQPLLKSLADLYPFQENCSGKAGCQMVILSKQPILATRFEILSDDLPVLSAQFGRGFGGLKLMTVHTLRPPRIYDQQRQMAALAARVRQETATPLIIAGDFNTTPFSLLFDDFVRASGLTASQIWPTWPAWPLPLPQLAIDHMFFGGSVRVLDAALPATAAASDHLPILASFAIRPAPEAAVVTKP